MSAERLGLASDGRFCLGDRLVTPGVNEIDGARIDPKAMDVLVALVEAAPAVMSGQALLDRVWPDVVVVPNVVYQAVAQLRKALGDHPHEARYIETIPRRGYRILAAIREPAPASAFERSATTPIPSVPSLAVLPFDNLSGDPEMAYFADGISEEIQLTVARGTDLKVIAKSSSFQFRGADKAVRNVIGELQATHLLDGSVRRSGGRVRISAQLVECATETAIWSESFDREMTDILVLQDEIAAAVAAALKTAFAPLTRSVLEAGIYDLYLRALALQGQSSHLEDAVRTLRMKLQMFESVVTSAPTFARGWGELAHTRAQCLRQLDGSFPAITRNCVVDAAETALRLDQGVGAAHLALSLLEPWGKYAEREALHRKALTVAPNDPDLLAAMGVVCADLGRLDESSAYGRQAWELSPIHAGAANGYAVTLDAMGRFVESRPLWDDFVTRWPNLESIAINAVLAAANSGDWERFESLASAARERGIDSRSFQGWVEFRRNVRHPDSQYAERAIHAAHKALAQTGTLPLHRIIGVAQLGLLEDAFRLIDKASFEHMFDQNGAFPTRGAPGLSVNIIFNFANRAMMSDVRFVALCAKLGLCNYWLKTHRWPDCADQAPYDFRSEAHRLMPRR